MHLETATGQCAAPATPGLSNIYTNTNSSNEVSLIMRWEGFFCGSKRKVVPTLFCGHASIGSLKRDLINFYRHLPSSLLSGDVP